MRKALIYAVGVLALAVASPLAASPRQAAVTKTVKITRTAFSPATVTIKTGDAVKWTNSDTRNHQVVANNGTFVSAILKPGQSYAFTFKAAGKYAYHDALNAALKGTVSVTGPPPAVTSAVSQPIITYGDTITLSGTVSNKKAGEQVTVYAKPYPQTSYAQLTTVLTTTNGTWDLVIKPTILTSYQVKWKATSSTEVTTAVKPRISLATARGYFSTRVTAGRSFAGRFIYVERLSSFGQWVAIKKLTLGRRSGKIFRLKLSRGTTRLRIFMTVNQAGSGYLAATSPTLTFRKR